MGERMVLLQPVILNPDNMKKRLSLFVALLITLTASAQGEWKWAQPKPTTPLPPEESKARLQQLGDSLGRYDGFENFDRHGWMVVEKVTKPDHRTYSSNYGIINDKGQTVLPCEYYCIRFQKHSDLIMVAKNSHSAGFMNRQLQWVIPPKFEAEDWCSMECDDYFQYGMLVTSDLTQKYGVVDSAGREILPCQYNWVEIAGQNLLLTYYENRYGALNRRRHIMIPFVYEHLHFLGDRYIEAKKQGLYGVITTSGQEILPFEYEQIWNYEKGLFAVKQNGKWGVVDSLNNLVIPFMPAQNIHIISKLDMFELLQENGRRQLLDKNGKVLVSSYEYSIPGISGKQIAIWGENTSTQDHLFCKIYDRNGEMVDAYNNIEFVGSKWVNDKTMIPVNRNGKWGFVNRDFQLVVPCLYDSPVSGDYGYGYATSTATDLPLVLFDEQGEPLIKGPYQWICPSVNGWFQVEFYPIPPMYLEGLIGFIDRYGNSTFTERDLLQIKGSYEDLFENEENLVPLLETWPEFPGGPDSLNAYLAKTIQYPQDARDNGISGTVLAEFSVEKDGQVGQVTIKVPLFPSCNEEVVRVLQQMPKWKPGTNQGLPVRCFMQVPVTFRGDKEADEDK